MNRKEAEKYLENLELGISVDGRMVIRIYDNDKVIAGRFLTESARETRDLIVKLSDSLMNILNKTIEAKNNDKN